MKRYFIMILVLSMPASLQAAELYHEEFTDPVGWDIADVGWAVVENDSVAWTGGGLAGEEGHGEYTWAWHESNPPTGYQMVLYTTEATINTTTSPYLGLHYDLRINYNETTPMMSVAVKVGGSWYVSKQAVRVTEAIYTQPGPFDTCYFYYNPAKENWDTLNIATGERGSTPVADLSGDIEGFGMHSDTGPVDGIDCTAECDNFTVKDVSALEPTPWDHAEMVDSESTVLQWSLDPSVTNCYVYFGSDPNGAGYQPKVIDGPVQTSYDPNTLLADTNYYWQVDVKVGESIIVGDPWTFKTAPEVCVVLTEPVSLTVDVGDTAEFSVETLNADTFQWYKDDVPVTIGGDISVVSNLDGSALTIVNVDPNDEGYYHCNATDDLTDVDSAKARLLTPRLMAHWKFEDNLTDEITGSTASGAAAYDTGIVGLKAFSFGDDPNYIEADDAEYFNFYPLGNTVSCWVKTSVVDSPMGIVSKLDTTSSVGGWVIYNDSGTTYQDFWGLERVETQNVINDGQWHFIVGTQETPDGDDYTRMRLYIDGKLADEAWATNNAVPDSAKLAIGNFMDWQNWPYEGLIDDVKIYNYALDGYEIAAEYTSVAGGTICVEPLDFDSNGDCVIDISDLKDFASEWLTCNKAPSSACN